MKRYIVTGAGRGIGLELTQQLLEMGHQVDAWVRTTTAPGLQKLQTLYAEKLRLCQVDVGIQASVDAVVREFNWNEKAPLDGFINNAGVYLDDGAGLDRLKSDVLNRTFEVNATAPMRVTQALLPALLRAQEPRVAHITSLMGSIEDNTSGGAYAYRMSKAALNMFERSFSIDYPQIISMALHPGWVKTEMGGGNAPVEPKDSARGLLKQFFGLAPKDSGAFLDFEGDRCPW